jgi:hypothetical protein
MKVIETSMQDGVFTIEVKMKDKTKLTQKTSIRKLHGALIPTCVISTWSLGLGMPFFPYDYHL